MNIDTTMSVIPATPVSAPLLSQGDGAEFSKKLDQALAAQGAKTAATAVKAPVDVKLKKVCQDMESVFLNMMLSTMRSTVPKDSLLGESNEDDIMKSMLDSEMSKNMARAGGVGIADLLYRQLSPVNAKAK